MSLEGPNYARQIGTEAEEADVIRLEERIASSAATSRYLVEQIEELGGKLSASERIVVEERWIDALDQRIQEFQAFEHSELSKTMKYWGAGVAIGASGMLVTGVVPGVVALALGLTVTVPVTISSIRQWIAKQKARKIARELHEVL